MTRRNDRRLITSTGEPVRNRETWTVTAIHADGSLTLDRRGGPGTVVVPAEYVRDHVRLGYAATEHGWQADTVDVSLAVTSPATSRRGLYVAATRGRDENHLHVVTDTNDLADARDVLEQILAIDRADTPATRTRRELAEHTRPPAPAPRPRCPIPDGSTMSSPRPGSISPTHASVQPSGRTARPSSTSASPRRRITCRASSATPLQQGQRSTTPSVPPAMPNWTCTPVNAASPQRPACTGAVHAMSAIKPRTASPTHASTSPRSPPGPPRTSPATSEPSPSATPPPTPHTPCAPTPSSSSGPSTNQQPASGSKRSKRGAPGPTASQSAPTS